MKGRRNVVRVQDAAARATVLKAGAKSMEKWSDPILKRIWQEEHMPQALLSHDGFKSCAIA